MGQSPIEELSPLFKVLLIAIAVAVIGWAAFKFAAVVLEKALSSRLGDCASIIPKVPLPIGANTTTPFG